MTLPSSTTRLISPLKRSSSATATLVALLLTVPKSQTPAKQPTRLLDPTIPTPQVQPSLPHRSSLTLTPILTRRPHGRRSPAYDMSRGRHRARRPTQARAITLRHSKTSASKILRVRTTGEAEAARAKRAVGAAEAMLTNTLGGESKVRLRD